MHEASCPVLGGVHGYPWLAHALIQCLIKLQLFSASKHGSQPAAFQAGSRQSLGAVGCNCSVHMHAAIMLQASTGLSAAVNRMSSCSCVTTQFRRQTCWDMQVPAASPLQQVHHNRRSRSHKNGDKNTHLHCHRRPVLNSGSVRATDHANPSASRCIKAAVQVCWEALSTRSVTQQGMLGATTHAVILTLL